MVLQFLCQLHFFFFVFWNKNFFKFQMLHKKEQHYVTLYASIHIYMWLDLRKPGLQAYTHNFYFEKYHF